jgi:hypothetical protein
VVTAVASVTLTVGFALAMPAGGSQPSTAAAQRFQLTATTAHLTGLTYDGTLDVVDSSGSTVSVLSLTAASGTLDAVRLDVACTAVPGLGTGIASVFSVPADAQASAGQGLHLLATQVSGTAGGQAVSWTPALPPPAADLGELSLADFRADGVMLGVPDLTAPGLAHSTRFCTP